MIILLKLDKNKNNKKQNKKQQAISLSSTVIQFTTYKPCTFILFYYVTQKF